MGDPKAFAGHVFKRFDTKKNGYIEITEFIIALSVTKNGTAEEKLHWEFGFYDIDGDGFITRDEMLQIVDATYKMVSPLPNNLPTFSPSYCIICVLTHPRPHHYSHSLSMKILPLSVSITYFACSKPTD
jgi:hypothetical protein